MKANETLNYPGKLSGNSLIGGTCPIADGIPGFTSSHVSCLSMCMILYKFGAYEKTETRTEGGGNGKRAEKGGNQGVKGQREREERKGRTDRQKEKQGVERSFHGHAISWLMHFPRVYIAM